MSYYYHNHCIYPGASNNSLGIVSYELCVCGYEFCAWLSMNRC